MKDQTSNARHFQQNFITALAFSKKADYCVVATKKDHTARIYKVNNLTNINSWTFVQEIKDHTQTISDTDWAADNKIVTSSHDRSVYVWRQSS
jgi:WD40 repeat protein